MSDPCVYVVFWSPIPPILGFEVWTIARLNRWGSYSKFPGPHRDVKHICSEPLDRTHKVFAFDTVGI